MLFTQPRVHFILPSKFKYYCRLLGMKIDKNIFVTNSTLAQAQNINNVKKFSPLIKPF